jgi:hypothetical protein
MTVVHCDECGHRYKSYAEKIPRHCGKVMTEMTLHRIGLDSWEWRRQPSHLKTKLKLGQLCPHTVD